MACLLTVGDFLFEGDITAEPRSSVACNSALDFSGAAMFVAMGNLCSYRSVRFVLKPQGFAAVCFAYGSAGFAYGLEVSQSSTAAAAAIQVSAADSHTFAKKYHNRPSESSQAYLRTVAVLQPGFLPACPSPSVLINSLGVVN